MTLSVHVPNDTIEANNADELKAAEKLELLGRLRIEEDARH